MEEIINRARETLEAIKIKLPNNSINARINPMTRTLVMEITGANQFYAFYVASNIAKTNGLIPITAGATIIGRNDPNYVEL